MGSLLALHRRVTRVLDVLYTACGGLAAVFMVGIFAMIVSQMVARWSGLTLPGSTDYAGYFMAASAFLALAHALSRGAHIRVNLLLGSLGRYRVVGEVWSLAVASVIGIFFAYQAIRTTFESHMLNDISQGQDATPLWIPQIAMSVGASVMAVALCDFLLRALLTGRTGISGEGVEGAPAAE